MAKKKRVSRKLINLVWDLFRTIEYLGAQTVDVFLTFCESVASVFEEIGMRVAILYRWIRWGDMPDFVRLLIYPPDEISRHDDPFMDDAEWEWHQWCEERRDVLNEFARAVAAAGYSVEDYNPKWFVMRGDDDA
ncbi:MAG: hypothetical protein RLP44_02435 [Aggregatilineales bacterium]